MTGMKYFEDATVGEIFESPRAIEMAPEAIKAFAGEWDPQRYHIDDDAAAASFAGGLTASALHTLAVGQKLAHESGFFEIEPIVGLALGDLEILKPVMAGDRLRTRVTITAMRASRSRPAQGIVENLTEVINQNDEVVLQYRLSELVRRRPDDTS